MRSWSPLAHRRPRRSSRRVPLGGLLLQDVVLVGLAARDLAGAGGLEALGRAAVGLHLRHSCVLCRGRSDRRRGPGAGSRRRRRRCRERPARWWRDAASASPSASSFCLAAWAAWAFLSGASTMVMLRPSSFGDRSRPGPGARRPRPRGRGSCAQLGVSHLAAPEHDRDLDLVALAQELLHLLGLGVEVARADLGPVLHLLDDDVGALLARLLGLLGRLVLVLAVVHDPADRGVGLVGHLDQVEVQVPGDGQGLGQGPDADLVSVGSHQADLAGADPVVDPGLVVGRRSYGRSSFMR